jgi:hypothetical protein
MEPGGSLPSFNKIDIRKIGLYSLPLMINETNFLTS